MYVFQVLDLETLLKMISDFTYSQCLFALHLYIFALSNRFATC